MENLGLFRKYNKISRNESLDEILNCAKASKSPAQAIGVVKPASAFSYLFMRASPRE